MIGSGEIVMNAFRQGLVIPSFNVPYLPMIEPVVRAVADQNSFAFIAIARVEWLNFDAIGPAAVAAEFARWDDPDHMRLHLDHVPVIDESGSRVEHLPILREGVSVGYHSVMIDASRLGLEDNIRATREAVELAHEADIPCEAELGAVMGHETGPLPPYDELFESGLGFTDVDQAQRFVRETGCDWLSVAIGSVHGAVSQATRDKRKVEARLNLDYLDRLRQATDIPLVLHGGSGVKQEMVLAAIPRGIAKVNVGTEIRQTYASAIADKGSVQAAQQDVYDRTVWLIRDYFGISGSRDRLV